MSGIQYLLEVDWDNDGLFWNAGRDVTARVRDKFSLTRGRDSIRQLAPPMAGTLNFILDNRTKDYTPEYSSSPLYGLVEPGRKARLWGTVWWDNFDRADASSLGAPVVGPIVGALGYVQVTSTWGIRSGKAAQISGTGDRCLPWFNVEKDLRVIWTGRGTLNRLPGGECSSPSMLFRYLDSDNFLFTKFVDNALALCKLDEGVESVLATNIVATQDDVDYVFDVLIFGNEITVAVNNTPLPTYTLSGGDLKYSVEPTGGWLLGLLNYDLPGSSLYTARWDDLKILYPLATCIIDDPNVRPERDLKSAEFFCLGVLSRLAGGQEEKKLSTELYENIRTDVALGYILDALGWTDTDDRVFDVGKTTLLYWWLDNADPFEAMIELLDSEGPGAAIYEDGWGRIHFESRHYRAVTTRSNTASIAFRDTGTEPLLSEPFTYNRGLKNVVNLCEAEATVREVQALDVVWEYGDDLVLGVNEVRAVPVVTTDPFKGAILPVPDTDYVVSAGSTTVAIDRYSGSSCTITFTAGASGATITSLQLRAQSVPVVSTVRVVNTIDTSASSALYGQRKLTLRNRKDLTLTVVQDMVNAVVGLYSSPRPQVILTVENVHRMRASQMVKREISDKVGVVVAEAAINGFFWIEQITHEVEELSETQSVHRTTFGCEAYNAQNYARWGSNTLEYTKWSNDGGTTVGRGVWGF